MFYLRAAMMGQLGRNQERLECLQKALSVNPVSDHSYMTKANAYWGELLEVGDAEKALRWLVNLSRNVPESHAPEVADMIAETAAAYRVPSFGSKG
jgi:tetratricopeptide (TPR) repeat protein